MSKGGSNTSSTEIPAWLENAAIENINKGRAVSEIGYTPYYGPEVAAFSPMQQQSMQSTGNAASAFGLAPQGFDAMAGMPEAQTFAGGIQGYSSAPLYEESLAQLQQNRPAQYDAINSMFIDPFTGARPQGSYAASPQQVEQMFDRSPINQPDYSINIDNSAVGGAGGTASGGAGGGSTGEYYGVNEQYNPYKYSPPTEDISGDGVIDYRDMSFGEAGRRDIGFGENIGNFIKSATGIGSIEKAIDYGQGLADGFTPSPSNGLLSQTSGAMDPADARGVMNEAAARYEAKVAQDLLAEQYGLYGAGQGFSPASTPAAQVESGVATYPYADNNITSNVSSNYDLMSNVAPATAAIDVNAEYDIQTRARDEELELEAEAESKAASDSAIEANTKRMLEESALISAEIKRKADAKKKSKSSDKRPQKTVTKSKSSKYSGQSAKKSTQGKAKTGYSFGL